MAIVLLVRQSLFQKRLQRIDVDLADASAQGQQLQRVDGMIQHGSFQPEARKGVFEQADDGNGVAGPERCLEQQRQQAALRGGGQRRACRIIGDDAEAGKFSRHATRQVPVGRNQRRLAFIAVTARLFQRQPQGNRDGRRLFALVRSLDQRDIGERRAKRAGRQRLLPISPAARSLGWRQRTGQDFGTPLQIDRRRLYGIDLGALRFQLPQQVRKAVLWMAAAGRIDPIGNAGNRRDHGPVLIGHRLVETRQYDDALRQGSDGGYQLGGGRHGTGRTGDDDRPCGLRGRQPFGLGAQDGIAMPGWRGPAKFVQAGRPEGAGDLQKFGCQLPPESMILGIQRREISPVAVFRLDRIDQFGKIARKPDRIGRAGRRHQR